MRIVSFEIMDSMASKDLLVSVLHLAFHNNSWPYLISQHALPITTGTSCGHSMFPAQFLQCFCIPASFPSLPPIPEAMMTEDEDEREVEQDQNLPVLDCLSFPETFPLT